MYGVYRWLSYYSTTQVQCTTEPVRQHSEGGGAAHHCAVVEEEAAVFSLASLPRAVRVFVSAFYYFY
jgi:hypothetical protein